MLPRFFEGEDPIDDRLQSVQSDRTIHILEHFARTDEDALQANAFHQNADRVQPCAACKGAQVTATLPPMRTAFNDFGNVPAPPLRPRDRLNFVSQRFPVPIRSFLVVDRVVGTNSRTRAIFSSLLEAGNHRAPRSSS